jgi:two-component system CheB/CheR fusion protein
MNKQNSSAKAGQTNKHFPIVAIGASAGGLEAMSELLQHLPSDTGMAYVYIQHTDPSHKDMLSSILSKNTSMKVMEAKHLLPIEKDHLYIIPANKDISITDGMLTLNTRSDKPAMKKPIDYFFTTLAEKQKDGAIGILLSGSASDGTVGLRAIKSAGGLTFAQDETAKFQSMPKSAIVEDVVDMVLPPKEIAKELQRLGRQADVIHIAMQNNAEELLDDKDEDLTSIIQLLKKSTSVDFTHYKMNTIKRRIIRRMLLHKVESIHEYLQFLKQHTAEVTVLYQDLLINVTTFFRDPDAMEYMKKTLFPRLVKNASSHDPLRIWVPACSTGEEAYSIAMILMEVLGDRAVNTAIQIFATDLSELAIAKARMGLYSPTEVAEIAPKRLQRFFTRVDGSYRIVKSVRDLCVFAPHNIFKDPPFSRLDFISCCNLMIYLDTLLQKKILATFHYALNTEGYLMLGKSETIGAAAQLFTQLEKKYKIYSRKKEVPSKAVFEMNYRLPEPDRIDRDNLRKPLTKESANTADLDKTVDNILLTKYVPASVVVNQELEILQFRGSIGLFLEPSPGKASLSLLKMARPGLAFELRNAIHKTNKSWQPMKKSGLEMNSNGQGHQVAIEVLPLKADSEERLFLVIFDLVRTSPATDHKPFTKDKMVKQLQDELNSVKEDMRSIIEEQEASNEELQSANEEIVSSNEELQSINEELETSKEEVESTNEELMTINTELQVRNEQLAESYEYAEAVFATIREAVIVLDQDFRVKSANRAFYKIFNAKEETTEGMLIYELGNRQWDIPGLRSLLEDVLRHNPQVNGYEIEHEFPQIGKKIMLLNARRIVQKIHRQQMILLAIEDITEHRNATAKNNKDRGQ